MQFACISKTISGGGYILHILFIDVEIKMQVKQYLSQAIAKFTDRIWT